MGNEHYASKFRREPYTIMRQDFSVGYGEGVLNELIEKKIDMIEDESDAYLGGFLESQKCRCNGETWSFS